MIKFRLFFAALFLPFFFSCTTLQEENIAAVPYVPDVPVYVFERPLPPVYIMGQGLVDRERLAFFLIQNNPNIDLNFVLRLAGYYIEEAAYEGVNHDVAFIQMVLETGFLAFGNLVTPYQNNFAGLGATGFYDEHGVPDRGMYFPTPRMGVRAQVQHLKAYATADPLRGELINPRRRFVRLGSSPTIDGLAGTWAADPLYAVKLRTLLDRLYEFAFGDD